MSDFTRSVEFAIGFAEEILKNAHVEPEAPRYLVGKALAHLQRARWTLGNPPANHEPLGPSRRWLQRALQEAGAYVDEDVRAGRFQAQDDDKDQGISSAKTLVSEIQPKIEAIQPKIHACRCVMRDLLMRGCKCGGI